MAVLFAGNGFHRGEWWARGQGKHMELGKVPSLVLGCERSNPGLHKNYSMLYSSHISWSSPTAPTPLELYPALAFDRLFKNTAERGDRSVLDAVQIEAAQFRRKISANDRLKLDEYLTSVREVEQRLERSGQQGELQGWRPVNWWTDPGLPGTTQPKDVQSLLILNGQVWDSPAHVWRFARTVSGRVSGLDNNKLRRRFRGKRVTGILYDRLSLLDRIRSRY